MNTISPRSSTSRICPVLSATIEPPVLRYDVFEQVADGIAGLLTNGSRIRLVVSPRRRKRNVAALTGRHPWSASMAYTALERDGTADALADWLRDDRYGCTSWLVRNWLLE